MVADQVTTWAKKAAKSKALGKYVRLAAKRHISDLKSAKKKGFVWDVEASERSIRFFTNLKHSKGRWAGSAFALAPWQAFIVGSLFGWKNLDGMRRFRVAYNEIPRKNGKSTLAAGVSIRLAFYDGEPGAEVYCAATKRDQAKIVWSEAKRMVESTPESGIQVLAANMNVPQTGSKLEPLGADADSTDGLNPHGVIIDELHAHKAADLVNVLQSASGARAQPLRFEITTAGFDRTSVCWKHHDYSVRVLEGSTEDETWFGFIAGADAGDDYTKPETWAKANLNLGISVYPQYIEAECKRAQEIPSEQNTFKRLHLNLWTEQSERWLDMAAWDDCKGPVNADSLRGSRCWAGLDMASRMDLSAAAYLFEPDEKGVYPLLMRFFMPAESLTVQGAKAIQRAEADRLRLLEWVDQGFITVTNGNVTDYDAVEAALLEDFKRYDLVELAYDPWNTTQLVTHLQDELGDDRLVPVSQSMSSLSSPSKELEKILKARKIRHGGNPVLRWMASNVAVKHGTEGQIKPDRKASAEKVDGIFALIDAISRATVDRTEGPSVYETRDMVVL